MSRQPKHRPHQQQPRNRQAKKDQPTPATTRRDQILADFATLRIPVTAVQLDAALAEAEKAGWSHVDFLHHLLADQAGQRRARALARRIKDANFRELKPLSEFDWNFNPALPRLPTCTTNNTRDRL